MSTRRMVGLVSCAVIMASVLACIILAAGRSNGLVAVTVTALDPDAEPTDHGIPLFKRREALPDYELALIDDNGRSQYLGVKPDESAADGLTWKLDDPVSVSRIAAVRLREKDKLVSDALAEVHIAGASVESNGYRFDFTTERSFAVGLEAFFTTPIGLAIVIGFGVAVFVIIAAQLGS